MSEVLSQNQIDALLQSVAQGNAETNSIAELPTQKTRKYDFSTPKKFSRESLRVLDSIYNNYARVVETQLSSILRMNCEVELIDVEEQKYNEFNNALMDNDVLTRVDFLIDDVDYEDPALMHISIPVVNVMLDRMLGGTGEQIDGVEGPFTEIELSLFESVSHRLVPLMNDSWQNYFPVSFKYAKIEENPRLLQSIAAEDTIVIVILNITVNNVSGQFNICLPGSSLEILFRTFETKRGSSNRHREARATNGASDIILSSISGSTLEVSVQLGHAEFNLADLYEMRIGDIINLRKPKDSQALLYVEGVPWYKGELGVQKQNIAIIIKEPISNT
jgi:flagellar motor switch protein FliM